MQARGAWDEAVEELSGGRRALPVGRGLPGASVWPRASSATSSRLRGEPARADAAYATSAEHGFDPQPGSALLWLSRGSEPRPSEPCGGSSWRRGRPSARTRMLPGAVAVLLAVGDLDTARTCASELDEHARSFGSDVLAARAALVWGLVEVACDAPAGALPHLRRAHQGWVRLDMPYESALAQAATGRALLALGDTESGRRTLAAARQAFVAVGARPDVDAVDRVVGPPSRPAGLSEREVEVLRLVAAGQSNAQIAAALVISDRTVARHLSNIFTKIDVGSRTAAASYAFAHDLL